MEAYQQNLEPVEVRRDKNTKEKLPCSRCKGWFVARSLSKHSCFLKKEERLGKGVKNAAVKSSRVFLETSAVNDEYREVEEKLVVGISDKTVETDYS